MSPASIAGDASGGPTPSALAAAHTVTASPVGSAAATVRKRCVAGGSSATRRRKLSWICPAIGKSAGMPNPPANSAGVRSRGHSTSASGFPRVSATIRSRTRTSTGTCNTLLSNVSASRVVQTVDDQFGKRGEISDRPTGCEHQTHRVGQQPPRDEHERLRRFAVEPLCAVDDAQQRTVFRHRREQTQDCQPDQQSVGRRPDGQTKSCPRRVPLRFRQRVEAIQHWRAQLVQRGEWNLHLRLDADRAHDPESRCRVDQMLEQRRLADARVAANHEHSCFADAHCVEKLFEREALLFAPDEIGATRRRARMNAWVDWQTLSPRRSQGYGCNPRLGSATRGHPGAMGTQTRDAEPHSDSSSSKPSEALMHAATNATQVALDRVTPSYCRVVLDNPPLNLMGPEFVLQIREIVTALENDDRVKVVVFESAVDGYFLNHSDFLANFEDLTSIPQGPTGLEAWPDVLVRLTRAPFVSIALIRGRATGNGSELALACDMSFASREHALLSQWEVGVGLVAGGGPMARLPRLMGRGRALEVLLSADDINGADAELLGYVNRALPDAELDDFVDALATRIASFDKWAIANTKRLVNEASLPPDVEIRAGWDACIASVKRPAAQESIKALLEQGLQTPGDTEHRLGRSVGQLGLEGER